MATKEYSQMTLEELDAVKLGLQSKIRELQAERDGANEFRKRRVQELHEQEANKQVIEHAEADNKSPVALAREWLSSDQPGRQVQAELFLGTHKSQQNQEAK